MRSRVSCESVTCGNVSYLASVLRDTPPSNRIISFWVQSHSRQIPKKPLRATCLIVFSSSSAIMFVHPWTALDLPQSHHRRLQSQNTRPKPDRLVASSL